MERPDFSSIKNYDDFSKYYWYLEELKHICRSIGISPRGGKLELMAQIRNHFEGKPAVTKRIRPVKKTDEPFTLDTRIVESGFTFGNKARDFFRTATGNEKFRFTADMVACVKKAKLEDDRDFSIADLLDVYYGRKEYAVYDKSSCQWNAFVKDFYADIARNPVPQIASSDTQKIVRALWKTVRDSDKEKIYTRKLLEEYLHDH